MTLIRPNNYDILVTIQLRAWNGEAMEPIMEGHRHIERFDDLVGHDHSVDDALRRGRLWYEQVGPWAISELGAAVLHLRWEQQVLPF